MSIIAADLFCGAGGTSTGLLKAAESLGQDICLVAVNHWDLAISTHSANHPGVTHFNSDLRDVDPLKVVPGGYLRLLVASPECTHFSRARGGKPMNKQSRASVKYVLRWVRALDVEDVLIENVPDFLDWGPLDPATMTPVKKRKGEYFYRFVRKLEEFGYQVGWRLLIAADYGDPTTRKRLFIQARKHQPICWPEPTHHRDGGDMFGILPRWRAAREIIDWSIKSESIFTRKHPLSPNTMRRIEAGLRKYSAASFILQMDMGGRLQGINEPLNTVTSADARALVQPFLMPVNHGVGDLRTYSMDDPIPTITGFDAMGIVEPFIVTTNWGQTNRSQARSLDEPLPTITGQNFIGLCEPFLVEYHGSSYQGGERTRSLDQPMPTIATSNQFGLAEPFLVEYYGTSNVTSLNEPLPTLTSRDRFALVQPLMVDQQGQRYLVDIRFRMLQPRELAAGMGFPAGYSFYGNREQVVKQIGNSVPVHLATQLCATMLGGK